MKRVGMIVSMATAILLTGCGGGTGGGSTSTDIPNTNISGGIPKASVRILIPSTNEIKPTNENVIGADFGEPDYRNIAVSMRVFDTNDFSKDNDKNTYPIYTKEVLHEYDMVDDHPYENSDIAEVMEWDYLNSMMENRGRKSKQVGKDYKNGNFSTCGIEYTDHDTPSNNYTINRDVKFYRNGASVAIIETSSLNSAVNIYFYEKNQQETGGVAYFPSVDAYKRGQFTYSEDYKVTDKSHGIKREWYHYNGDANSSVDLDSVFDGNGFFAHYNFVSSENMADTSEYQLGGKYNREHVNHRHLVHLGDMGNGNRFNQTKPMYAVLSCDVSNDSYAVVSAEGDLLECNEDLNGDSVIDKVTKYTWYDEWRLDKRETTQDGNTTLEDFQYSDFGNIRRIVTYLNGAYVNHKTYIYMHSIVHTQPN